ncbi:unnamed protein product [Rotaria sp. Silwood2]|nr:unnamed protein product [Rotaria sp. Silwood2]CAF4141435.1 unnamed protein product [Rotaria sp. Silwood2]
MLPVQPNVNDREKISEIVHDILNEISLEALSLAKGLNNRINKCVPFKYHHIASILNETLEININPSVLENLLNFISEKKLADDYIKFFHDFNVELILSAYSLNKSLLHIYVELCAPILLVPFCDRCPNCNRKFELLNMKWRTTNIFKHDGTSKKGTMLSFKCDSKECHIIVFSNHYRTEEACVANFPSFNNNLFYYYDGDSACQRTMFDQFALLLSRGRTTFYGFTDTMNSMPGQRCSYMDRRKFEFAFLTYEWIKYSLFIGKQHVFLPKFSRGSNEKSFDQQFKRIMENSSNEYTRFWSKIVLEQRKCLIVDGTWKLRRAICSNKSVYRYSHAYDLIETGCPNTRMLV